MGRCLRILKNPLIPLILWMGMIFAFSSMPGSGSNIEPPRWYVLERKGAHVFEYAVLTLLAFRFMRSRYLQESFGRVVLLSAAFSLMYAATDELHQFFVFGRGAKMADVMIDGGGILLMTAVLFLFRRWSRKKDV